MVMERLGECVLFRDDSHSFFVSEGNGFKFNIYFVIDDLRHWVVKNGIYVALWWCLLY